MKNTTKVPTMCCIAPISQVRIVATAAVILTKRIW